MRITAPDYYNEFSCIAGACRHSCCIGWEIDIDGETLAFYDGIGGELGQRLQKNICREGGAHFCLDEKERCPFLNGQGLCDIIIEQGEEALCQICDDHPRFRNFFSDREEIGLGLCCEAAAQLIVSRKEKTGMIVLEEGEEVLFRGRGFSGFAGKGVHLFAGPLPSGFCAAGEDVGPLRGRAFEVRCRSLGKRAAFSGTAQRGAGHRPAKGAGNARCGPTRGRLGGNGAGAACSLFCLSASG